MAGNWWDRAPYTMPNARVPAPNPYMPQAGVPGTLDPMMLMLGMPGVRSGAMAQPPQSYGSFDGFSENVAPTNYAPPMHGGFSENAMPQQSPQQALPMPPPSPPGQYGRPQQRNMLTAASRGGGMSADDLNAISLAAARGENMPAGVSPEMWARIRGR